MPELIPAVGECWMNTEGTVLSVIVYDPDDFGRKLVVELPTENLKKYFVGEF